MSGTSKLGRNDLCPCGHGKKVKKCHSEYVGLTLANAEWLAEMRFFIECQPGYVEPMATEERTMWKKSGCPFGTCHNHDNSGCAAQCGV